MLEPRSPLGLGSRLHTRLWGRGVQPGSRHDTPPPRGQGYQVPPPPPSSSRARSLSILDTVRAAVHPFTHGRAGSHSCEWAVWTHWSVCVSVWWGRITVHQPSEDGNEACEGQRQGKGGPSCSSEKLTHPLGASVSRKGKIMVRLL